MERRRGLSKTQKFCIVGLWVLLSILLFFLPSDKSIYEKIFIAVASGVIIVLGVNAGQNRMNNFNRKRRKW